MSARRSPVARSHSPRTVLLAVSGMSPAILTETVWALSRERPRTIPDEVVVLTTSAGARDIQSLLLQPGAAWNTSPWAALRRAVLGDRAAHSSVLQLAAPRVIELPDPQSGVKRPAEDLRTPAENAAAADFILEEVRRLTENADTRVVASIAGGRKTMGALLYAAMSLLGREADRLTHVLVSEPYDRCRDFFFPGQPVDPKAPHPGTGTLSAAKARVNLADIPFVPLRNLFERDFARRPGSFATLVAEASRRLPAEKLPAIRIYEDSPRIEIGKHKATLNPREHVLLLLLARQCADGKPPFPNHPHAFEAYQALVENFRAAHRSNDFSDWRGEISRTTESGDLRKLIHGLRTKLKKAGPEGIRLAGALQSRTDVAFRCDPAVFTIIPAP